MKSKVTGVPEVVLHIANLSMGRQPPKVITEVTPQPYYNVRVLHSSSMQHL